MKHGKIITFYSYKGGTGRSMALANVAWILASNGKRVLTIDWDLEAPGLHRYFYPFLVDKTLAWSDGVINFVSDYKIKAMTPAAEKEHVPEDWYVEYANIHRYAIALEWKFENGGRLDFVPAGRQDSVYTTLVNLFSWSDFYERLGGNHFLNIAKANMQQQYDYILVDSRTGVSDTSGICTVQLPDTLVVCFTLNNQSILGAAAAAESICAQRVGSSLEVFPVPMRIENGDLDRFKLRWQLAKDKFSGLIGHLSTDWDQYWKEVAVPYVQHYAYEEILAPFGNLRSHPDNINLLTPAERLASFLTNTTVICPPIECEEARLDVLSQFATTSSQIEEQRKAEVEKQRAEEGKRKAEEELQRLSAKHESEFSKAQVELALSNVEKNPQLGLQLAVEAGERLKTDELRHALVKALSLQNLRIILEGHTEALSSAVFSPNGEWVLTASEDGTAHVWESLTGKQVHVFEEGGVQAAFSPRGKFIATTNMAGTVHIFQAGTWKMLYELQGYTSLLDMAFSPNDEFIVTVNEETVCVWKIKTGKHFALRGHSASLISIEFSRDGRFLVSADLDGTARVCRVGTWKAVELHDRAKVETASISYDGKFVVTVNGTKRHNTKAYIWDVGKRKVTADLVGHKGAILSYTFSPSGKYIITASEDATACIWETETGSKKAWLRGHTGPVYISSTAFSSDEQFVVTASADSTARVWETETGRTVSELRGHTGAVTTAVFSPDGKRIVTASQDKTARIWDAQPEAYGLDPTASIEDLLSKAKAHLMMLNRTEQGQGVP